MQRHARRRAELRPQGGTNIGCKSCDFLSECGGVQTARPLLDCFEERCCHKEDCDIFCPNNVNFLPMLRDVGDLNLEIARPLPQTSAVLPTYVPVIHHGYRRRQPLCWPWVALDTYDLFVFKNGRYQMWVESPEALRAKFKLGNSTMVILRGVAKDPDLERFWAHRRIDRAAEQIARLGVSIAVGPNFSMFLDVPRLDHIWNMKRQLLCLEDMADAGIHVVPHLSAVSRDDWRSWISILKEHSNISYVAKEFQTGNRSPSEGEKALRDLANVQQAVGRALHPLLIGAVQFTEVVARHFDRFTLIDSAPFTKARSRRSFDSDVAQKRWVESPTAVGEPLDALLFQNIERYTHYIERRVSSARSEPGSRRPLPSA